MRAIILALAMVVSGSAMAQQAVEEHRVIANAAYVLGVSGTTSNRNLKIYTADRAAFTGTAAPALIQRFDTCTFAIKSKEAVGIKVNFSLIAQNYRTQCRGNLCELTFSGPPGSVIAIENDGRQFQTGWFRTNPMSPSEVKTLIGSINFINEAGCGPYVEPSKPRF